MAEVVTGEAVVIDVPCARFPSRAVALAIDLLIQIVLLVLLSGVAVAAAAGGALNPAALAALALTVFVLIVVGYPATIETLSRGRSLGKLALGLRVVSDDGGPERFRQALMRALLAVLEIWLTLRLPGPGHLAAVGQAASGSATSSPARSSSPSGCRSRAARPPRCPRMPPALAGWAASAAAVRAGRRHGGNRPPVPEPVLHAHPGGPHRASASASRPRWPPRSARRRRPAPRRPTISARCSPSGARGSRPGSWAGLPWVTAARRRPRRPRAGAAPVAPAGPVRASPGLGAPGPDSPGPAQPEPGQPGTSRGPPRRVSSA